MLRCAFISPLLAFSAHALAATVVLDAGHTPEHPGYFSPHGRSEYEYNIALVDEVSSRLKRKGIRVITPQVEATHAGNLSRLEYTTEAALFVTIHYASAPDEVQENDSAEDQSGYGVYVSAKNPAPAASYRCARLVGAGLLAVGEAPVRGHIVPLPSEVVSPLFSQYGVFRFDDLLLLKASSAPAVQVEAGVIANPEEARRLEQPGTVRRLGLAIAESIAQCLA